MAVEPDIKPADCVPAGVCVLQLLVCWCCCWSPVSFITGKCVSENGLNASVTLSSNNNFSPFKSPRAVSCRLCGTVKLIVWCRWRRKWQLNNNTTFIRQFGPEQQEVKLGQNRWFWGRGVWQGLSYRLISVNVDQSVDLKNEQQYWSTLESEENSLRKRNRCSARNEDNKAEQR